MQTFLPYQSFSDSAKVLDYRRLGKQRVECKQILNALGFEVVEGALRETEAFVMEPDIVAGKLVWVKTPKKAGWANHPATKMWAGYEHALAEYMTIMVMEWVRRGYNNTMPMLNLDNTRLFMNPPWLGDEALHASHRSNLLRKDPTFYGQYGWTESPDLEYVWPEVPAGGPQKAQGW